MGKGERGRGKGINRMEVIGSLIFSRAFAMKPCLNQIKRSGKTRFSENFQFIIYGFKTRTLCLPDVLTSKLAAENTVCFCLEIMLVTIFFFSEVNCRQNAIHSVLCSR